MIPIDLPPTSCKDCGTILHWRLAEQFNFHCPTCTAPCCYACGCTQTRPCQKTLETQDRSNKNTYFCSWSPLGPCSICMAAIALELYDAATAIVTSLTENDETLSVQYIEEKEWAEAKGLPLNEAREELETLTKEGKLQKMFRYDGSDSPVSFLVTEEMLDTSIRLSELGDFGEDNDKEITVSRLRTQPVYIPTSDFTIPLNKNLQPAT